MNATTATTRYKFARATTRSQRIARRAPRRRQTPRHVATPRSRPPIAPMKRSHPDGSENDSAVTATRALARDAHVARVAPSPGGSSVVRRAAAELAIDTEDELSDEELRDEDVAALEEEEEEEEDAKDDARRGGNGGAGGEAFADAPDTVPQEELIRRRLGRMKELHSLYNAQYWRLLEDLRRRHYRYTLRNGHGGKKEDASAEAAEREREGLPSQCDSEGCDRKPLPLSRHCLDHILLDPKQQLYVKGVDGEEDCGPVLWTEDESGGEAGGVAKAEATPA